MLTSCALWLPSGARRVRAELASTRVGDSAATRAPVASLGAILRASLPLRASAEHVPGDVLADASRVREIDAEGGWFGASPARAVDGDDESAWVGDASAKSWRWTIGFRAPVHLGLIRARWGFHASFGVPSSYAWEVVRPAPGSSVCADGASEFEPLADARESARLFAGPTRRSWFVRTDACALRLRVDATVLGPPVLREVELFEPAHDVLLDAAVESEGAAVGTEARDAADERYDTAFVGLSGRATWSLTFRLPRAETIDRVSMVLGADATSHAREGGVGRDYGIAAGPSKWSLEASADGRAFEPIADTRSFGALPVRRPSIVLRSPRTVRALRLVVHGATDMDGLPCDGAFPVVREVAAYRAGDRRSPLQAPWLLSVNANPTAQSHWARGGELANDFFFAKFLQQRFSQIVPALARDDRFARALSPAGNLREVSRTMRAGELVEAIEGDDPSLGPSFLSSSGPPPIVVLSGANDWDYPAPGSTASTTPADRKFHWNPLRDAAAGGMRQLALAVQSRVAPFLGFCGGAQILALLAAVPAGGDVDGVTIAQLLRRNDGRPIGDSAPAALLRSWPGIAGPRPEIDFAPDDPLFVDISGAARRHATHSMPEWHVDAVRPEAFSPDGALSRLRIVAESRFCREGEASSERCVDVPEAFRSREPGWPIVGTQFHPEQYDFPEAPAGDPEEAIGDARLFVNAYYELVVDAMLRKAT